MNEMQVQGEGKKVRLQAWREKEDLTEIEVGNERNKEMNGKKLLNSQIQLIMINAKKERKKISPFEGQIQYSFRWTC